MRNLFDLPIDKDYHKPIRSISVFNGNYIWYESKGGNILTMDHELVLESSEYHYLFVGRKVFEHQTETDLLK